VAIEPLAFRIRQISNQVVDFFAHFPRHLSDPQATVAAASCQVSETVSRQRRGN